MPRYVTIDLFGKVGVGKTTIFNLFAGNRFLKEGGNLMYDFRTYYARCWILPRKWDHSMVFLTDPKTEMRWRDLQIKRMQKLFEPTNILIIVTDSTEEDVRAIKKVFRVFPRIKRKLIIFIIANMQDVEGRLSVDEIKEILVMKHVLGISALHDTDAKARLEEFFVESVMVYFTMLSKRGETMELLDESEIGLGKDKTLTETKKETKYSKRLEAIKKRND